MFQIMKQIPCIIMLNTILPLVTRPLVMGCHFGHFIDFIEYMLNGLKYRPTRWINRQWRQSTVIVPHWRPHVTVPEGTGASA